MDNFAAIYKILNALEKSMDFDNFDAEAISAEWLGITENQRWAILKMLADSGYIEGVHFHFTVDGALSGGANHPRITLKGLEYLEENSLMKRAYNVAKGIKDILPM